MLNTFSKILLLALLPIQVCFSQLVPIDEAELSGMTGQAFVNIDHTPSIVDSNVDFTKLTFGLEVKTSLNSDLLELGRYPRAGETNPADIRITDFALGHIDSDGKIVPFEITDPFIELAFDNTNGNENLVGVRLGFGGALGKLSGNIESLTGNVDVNVYGKGSYLASQMSCSWDPICSIAKALVGGSYGNDDFSAKAELIHGSGGSIGSADPIRASHIGILDNQTLSMPSGSSFDNWLLTLFSSKDCSLLSVNTCFPLTNFKSLEIGNNGSPSEGLFISFQSQAVSWQDGSSTTLASEGAFMNIPNGGINVTFVEAIHGIDRERTRYVDPYFGGF